MARQYSHRQFFRRTPNALLARYFKEWHNVLLDIDFEKLAETDVEPLFEAIKSLPSDIQAGIEAECLEIDAMACQGGWTALIDEADFHGDTTFPAAYGGIGSFHGAVMWAFLEHLPYWAGATLFLHADNIADSFWKKRGDLPHLSPHVEPEDIEQMEEAISYYFHEKEGRGRNCKVEVFRRHEKEYFFAYPEDFAQSGLEWESDALAPRSRHPAFEIVFVYSQAEGSLDIYAPRNTKAVPELQELFAHCILKFEGLDAFAGEKRVYVLTGLADPDFVFQYPQDCGIESVAVSGMRLTMIAGLKRRVTVEADTTDNISAVYDLLALLKLPPYRVTQTQITVTFAAQPGVRARKRSFKISAPNWCALRHDGNDLIIRKMLASSGIEPMAVPVSCDQ